MKARLTKIAEADIERVMVWYEQRREGLGGRFHNRAMQAIEKIKQSPLGHSKVIKNARKVELQKFPYALWYIVEPDESVVIGCLHGKRDRILAKERALGVLEMPTPKEPTPG